MKHVRSTSFGAAMVLALSGCTTNDALASDAAPAARYQGTLLTAGLSGTAAAPNPGDADGSGQFALWADEGANRLCYELGVAGIDYPTAAHIHRGGAGEAGPPVVTLQTPAPDASEGCTPAEAALITEIINNPDAFYAQVHTQAHPQGALRGQLSLTDPE